MQHTLMAVWGRCYATGYDAADQQRDEAEALPAEPCYTTEVSCYERLEARGVHSAYANPHPHNPQTQVTMDTEHKLDEQGYADPRAYGSPRNAP
jgi:hypothetical protein